MSAPRTRPDPGTLALWALGAAWLAAALLWAVPAPFSIDEFIYWAMADAFAQHRSLFVDNGPAAAPAFRLALLVPSGDRLAAQYPGGWGILTAPALQLAGLRGILLVNTLASLATLWLVRQTAMALCADRSVATWAALIWGFGTFAVDYALAIWPHAAATCAVTAAMLGAARGWRQDRPVWALAAGLALGAGLNLRVDVVLALPPLALWLMATGRRPWRHLLCLGLGTLPGLGAAAAINWVKFADPTPISYGRSDGYVSLAHHAPLLALAALLAAAALALGHARVRAMAAHPAARAAAALALAAALATSPAARDLALRLGQGVWALVVDFQDLAHPAPGVAIGADGVLTVFGLLKSAVLHSAPVLALGLLALRHLTLRPDPAPDRAAVALCGLMIGAIVLPFAPNTWHGGASLSMRYLLHALPAAAILAALALRDLRAWAGGGPGPMLAACAAVAGWGLLWPMLQGRAVLHILRIDLPGALAGTLALGAIGLALAPGPWRAALARGLALPAYAALVTGLVVNVAIDLQVAQAIRRASATGAARTADLAPDALVVSYAAGRLALRLNRPPALTAQPDYLNPGIDADLAARIAAAQTQGRPVYADGNALATELLARGLARTAQPVILLPWGPFYRMTPP